MPFLKRNSGILTIALASLDSCCVLAAYALAIRLGLPDDGSVTFREAFHAHILTFVLFVVVWCGTGRDHRIFESHRSENLPSQLYEIAKAVIISLVFTGFVVAFFKRQAPERDFLLAFGLSTLAFISLFRAFLRIVLWSLRRQGYNYRQVLIVGANERSEHLTRIIKNQGRYGYRIMGVLENDRTRAAGFEALGVPHMGGFEALGELLTHEVVDEVYICLTVRSHYETIQDIAYACEGVGVPVRLLADLFPLRIAKSHVYHILDVPLLSLSTVPESQLKLTAKRLVDFTASSIGLLILGPTLFLVTAILIKLTSKGPVFFLQERVGLHQRRFKIMKFRTMVVNAEEMREKLEELNEADGPVFKIRRDPRLTKVGHFLRKYSIDEFPQLINVWRGQMSLVGPRPPIPSEVEEYTWEQRRRLSVKPGMTGLWQVSGRSDIGFKEWVQLDLQYIDTWSLVGDFRILMKTFKAVIHGRGAA